MTVNLVRSPKRADVVLTEQQKFVVSYLELIYLIMALTEAAHKKMSEGEVIVLTLVFHAQLNSTLGNIADLKVGIRTIYIEDVNAYISLNLLEKLRMGTWRT